MGSVALIIASQERRPKGVLALAEVDEVFEGTLRPQRRNLIDELFVHDQHPAFGIP